jgi:hypothetical protein
MGLPGSEHPLTENFLHKIRAQIVSGKYLKSPSATRTYCRRELIWLEAPANQGRGIIAFAVPSGMNALAASDTDRVVQEVNL